MNTMLYAYNVPDDHEGKKYTRGSRALSVEDELLLTLVKLCHNFPESDLALRFGISQSTVSRIFLCLDTVFVPFFEGNTNLATTKAHRHFHA